MIIKLCLGGFAHYGRMHNTSRKCVIGVWSSNVLYVVINSRSWSSDWLRRCKMWAISLCIFVYYHQTTPQPFYGPFSRTTRVSWCQKRTSGLYGARGQGEINRGRHTHHPAGRHSIRANQCPPPPSPIFTGRMPFLPPNQQCQSTEGN